jgi:hypothetical protein
MNASVASLGGMAGGAAYTASKNGVAGLVRGRLQRHTRERCGAGGRPLQYIRGYGRPFRNGGDGERRSPLWAGSPNPKR